MTKKRTKNSTVLVDPEADERLRLHLHALGLENADEYKNWCRQHGFSGHLHKDWRRQQRERLIASREVATNRLAESKKKANSPKAVLDVFTGRLRPDESRAPTLSAIWRASEALKDQQARAKLLALLLHVQPLTDFLDSSASQPGRRNTWIDGLVALAHHWQLLATAGRGLDASHPQHSSPVCQPGPASAGQVPRAELHGCRLVHGDR